MPDSRWEHLVWPQWLPVRARLPLVAQILGVVTLTALLAGPFWSTLKTPKPLAASAHPPLVPHATAIAPASPRRVARPDDAARSAHLNLDVRHSFGSVNFSVAVDGRPVLRTVLTGSGKKFKMFGKRAERGFTRTLDLAPGVRVVQVRVTSPEDKFDQSRSERFDLESASVAAMQIAADRSGLSVVVRRPAPAPAATAAAPREASIAAAPVPVPAASPAPAQVAAPVTASAVATTDASIELLRTMRSMLIAIMGFVASAATGFIVQEFLRSRRDVLFDRRRKNRRRQPAST
jgi:hypothetical protein